MPDIVILGGNMAGVSTAHYLLRHVFPRLKNEQLEYKVVLISPSTHTFFSIAAPRVLSSDEVENDKAFASIPDAFSQYKPSEFAFIQGEAVGLDAPNKTVSVKGPGATTDQLIRYDSLVIATGAKSASPLWTLHGDHKTTLDAFQRVKTALPAAKSILIAGGGPAGVEVAGEIGHLYKGKDITLLSGGTRLLPRFESNAPGNKAEQHLAALSVRVLHGVRVASSKTADNDKVSLSLSDGTTRTVDLYIDATGGKPNTNFLPAEWLDAYKRVGAEASTLRATKAPAGVYAIGDAASYSKGCVPDATFAVPALGYSIWFDLRQAATKQGAAGTGTAVLKEKTYKQFEKDMGIVPVGPSGGVGMLFGWSVPSFIVWLLKARTFMLGNAPGLATGSQFLKP